MDGELPEVAQEYYDKKQHLSESKQELTELRSNVFGDDSEEVKEKAQSLFENVGVGNGNSKRQKVNELEQEVSELEQEIDELEEKLQRKFTEIRFPFDETIENREEEEVAFPFADPILEEVIEALDDVIRNNVNGGEVELRTEEIVVYTDDVSEAISAVENFAEEIREAARHELNTDEYVEKLASRDVKIQRMLYELYESDDSLAKKELEERSGVEKGGLRGVLYSVYDRDQYLVKENKKYSLSEIGQSVMEKFAERHEKPEIQSEEKEQGEEQEEQEDQENQLTLDSTGDSNE